MRSQGGDFMRLLPLLICTVGASAAFAETPAPAPLPKEAFLEQIGTHFAGWDSDHNGTLSDAEIDALVINPKITGAEAAAVGALKRAARGSRTIPAIAELTADRIKTLVADAPEKGQPNLPSMFDFGLKRITSTNRTLFGASEGGQPRLETIHQGKLGNCFCLAPLGALVQGRPAVMASMFRPQPDGSYEVKLGQQSVHVQPPTDAELAFIASNESAGLWVNLYEKAVGQTRNELKPETERSASAIEALARGGSAGTMLAVITGHEITRFSCKWAKDDKTTTEEGDAKLAELRGSLTKAVRERRLMTCGTTTVTTPGLTPNHAYAILSFDEGSDCLKIWNPHGGIFKPKGETGLTHGYPMTDGVFEIPTTEFVKQFSGLAFEELPAS
jgi:hypothetical protein